MKLEVGMYVRTKDGEIHRIKSITNEYIEYENGFGVPYELREYIVKEPSFNPIDLIEVGDYVNGERIRFVTNKKKLLTDGGYYILSKYEAIKSIVTKESFLQMEYKVEE